jgi:hypothetical protein
MNTFINITVTLMAILGVIFGIVAQSPLAILFGGISLGIAFSLVISMIFEKDDES